MDKNYWLDVDGCVADFCSQVINYLKLPDHEFTEWNDPRIRDNWHLIENDLNFWLTIPPINKDIGFKVAGYITSRPVLSEVTEFWLWRHGFPKAEVVTVKPMGSKGEILKTRENAVLIDDGAHNYEDALKHGVECLLFDTPYNRHIETDKRIYSLKTLT